ncbi:MAG: hypothetical protein J0M08_10095 [Bacteroidetes bacterium]|nr:hypothetical protein [Bacteroidota bacterium]
MTLLLAKKSNKTRELNTVIVNSVDKINSDHWNLVLNDRNIYLSLAYLQAIEKSLKRDIAFRYLLFYNAASKPVAIAVVQCLLFIDKGRKEHEQFCSVRNTIKDKIVDPLGAKVLVCGNPFSCGENGFLFVNDISAVQAYINLAKELLLLQKREEKELGASLVLAKEFWPSSVSVANEFEGVGFKGFFADVNMVLALSDSWKSFDDYLLSMNTKFRTKAKAAYKKSTDVVVKEFEAKDIIQYSATINYLYGQVLDKSLFKFGELNADVFCHLKKALKKDFIFTGYFVEENLVGFSTAFISNATLDANYVGINYNLNQKYALYSRMLYDYVALAITRRCSQLSFGRTAEEIKSSVGALPVNMKLYIRHKNILTNKLVKSIVGAIKPSKFELRAPFKVA